MKINSKWCFAGMFVIDFVGRKIISLIFGAANYREMVLRAIRGQEFGMYRGVICEILFSAILWSLLPLWAGIKTKQTELGCLLTAVCFLASIFMPILNLTPIVFGIGSYLYLENRAAKETSS